MKKLNIAQKVIYMIAAMLLFNPLQVYGQPAISMSDLLRQTEEYYQKVDSFTARFHQVTTSAVARTMTTEATGTLYYQKPRQMRWEYETPEEQIFVANQQLAWLHVPGDRQISLFDSKALFSSPLAQTFFDGFVELRKNFDVTLESHMSSHQTAVLRLVPKTHDPGIRYLFLWIDRDSHRIEKLESHDAMGNMNLISLEDQRTGSPIEPHKFHLEIPPSTVVLDLEGRQMSPAEIEELKKKLLR